MVGTMIDLSSIIPDLAYAVAHTDLNGIYTPENANVYPVIPSKCRGCNKAADGENALHKCHSALREGNNATELHNTQAIFVNATNAINNWFRIASKYIETMNAIHNRVLITNQRWVQSSQFVYYTMVSASSSAVTVRWLGGEENDPRNFPLEYFHEVADWIPGENERYVTDVSQVKLPARGWLTITGDSILNDHAPWLVSHITIPEGFGAGDTFTIHLNTPISADVMYVPPYSSDPPLEIQAKLEFNVGGWYQPFPNPRDVFPFWGTQADHTFALTPDIIITIDKLCRWHSGDSRLVSAVAQRIDNLAWDNVTAIAQAHMSVTYNSGWATKFDFTGVDLTAYSNIKITLYEWDANGQYLGSCTCANDRIDYSNSYGTTVGSWKHFCSKPTCARYANYAPGSCYQPGIAVGNEWIEDTPSTPFKLRGWDKLTHGIGWRYKQIAAGMPLFILECIGPSGLLNIAPTKLQVPASWSETSGPYKVGGWEAVRYVDDMPIPKDGLEIVWADASVGPAGENITVRYKDAGAIAEDRTVNKAQITMCSPDIHSKTLEILTSHGSYQECGVRKFDLVIPDITPGNNNNFYGGILSFGKWDQYGQPTSVDNLVKYGGHIRITENFDTINRGWRGPVSGGIRVNTKIMSAESLGNKQYKLNLQNQIVTCGSISPGNFEDFMSSWRSGGTNVAMPDPLRLNNGYTAGDYGCRGARKTSTIQEGWGCKFLTGSSKLKNKVFQVTAVGAADGEVQPRIPEEDTHIRMQNVPYVTYPLNATETLNGVLGHRNSEQNLLYGYKGFPFVVDAAKDVFLYEQIHGLDENGDETNNVVFKFSHLNLTALSTDYTVHLTISTDENTYEVDWDLVNDPTVGINARDRITITSDKPILDADLLVSYTDSQGNAATAALSEQTLAFGDWSIFATFSYMVFKIEEENSYTWMFFIAPQLDGSSVRVTYTIDDPFTGTESEYWDQRIAPHSPSFPTLLYSGQTYEEWSCKSDTVIIQDEDLDLIAAEGGVAALANLEVGFGDVIYFHHAQGSIAPDLYRNNFNTADPDTALVRTTDFDLHGANGDIWLTKELTLALHNCIFIKDIALAYRSRMPRWVEIKSIRSTIEKLMST